MKTPLQVWSRGQPTRQELLELLHALNRGGISADTRELFEYLASKPPSLRLAINLKSFLGESVVRGVENILVEGLAPEERKALLELDAAELPIPLREVAHGLLAVHERWTLWKAMRRPFTDARARPTEYVERKLLDEVLGGDV